MLCTQICVFVKTSGKQMGPQTHCFYILFTCISQYFLQWTCDTFVIRKPEKIFWYIRKKKYPFHLLSLSPSYSLNCWVLEFLLQDILTEQCKKYLASAVAQHSLSAEILQGCLMGANTVCMSSLDCHKKKSTTHWTLNSRSSLSQSLGLQVSA